MSGTVDLLIIGGGINGAGIARDAAGRGLSVVMVEKDDLAAGTSSRSGKLVHGGLRYLEYYEFRLVREALIEREVLLESAPHIIWPMRFVLPHSPDDRPAWLVRLGLFLYDHLGGRKRLPGTRTLNLRQDAEGKPLKDTYAKGFEYSDCWVDDARLVVLNAVDARERGAEILTRTECASARREDGLWIAEIKNSETGDKRTIRAKALVNAAGPWVTKVIEQVAGINSSRKIRLVKGSHIIVEKFWDGPQAYLVQNTDKRVIFINPYEDDKALIGTTDIHYEGKPESVEADESEISYLIAVVNRYFKHQLTREDVLHTFSGVRPLYDDDEENPSAVTRDYILEVDSGNDRAPMLNVFGGKITTFRKLSEHAMDKLKPFFPKMAENWTAKAHLPGGQMENADYEGYLASLESDYPFLPRELLNHYGRLYGTRTHEILSARKSLGDLGHHFGSLFYECEAHYLVESEWATNAEDILTRRTKHALHMSKSEIASFESWFRERMPRPNNPMNAIKTDPQFKALCTVSARAGSDPLLVQAAGGNTSIKRDGVLWIKASGKWLMNAERDDIFVPVNLSTLMQAFERNDGSAENAQDFVISDLNPSGLRPSIETTVHSVIPQDIVIHVHCVGTIAHAVRADARAVFGEKLAGLEWVFIPYVKPGVTLAHQIRAALKPETRIVILGNHGLVVSGDTVADAETLMDEVHQRLIGNARSAPAADVGALKSLAGLSGYAVPEASQSHAVAMDSTALAMAARGSLYPDHVIFLGIGSVLANENENVSDVCARIEQAGLPRPVSIVFPGKGVLMSPDANAGAEALARCLADVTVRIPQDTNLNYLSDEENAELLSWDAEKYRQALNRKSSNFA